MKKAAVVLFAVFLNTICFAQNFTIKWSEKFKVATGIFTNSEYVKSFPAAGESIISLFRKVRSSNFNNDFVVMIFNASLDVAGQLELDYPDGAKEGFIDLVKLKQNYYLIEYRYTSKTTVDILVSRLNVQTLKKELPEKKIAEIDDSNSKPKMYGIGIGTMYNFDMNATYSADSSKLLLTYEPEQRKKDTKEVQMVVFNHDLEKVYVKNYQWEEPFNKIHVFPAIVDNDGKAYMCYNLYEKNFNKDFIKSDGDKIPAYTTNMLIFDKGTTASYTFANDNKFIHNVGLAYGENRQPVLIGMYKDKNNGRLSGVFKTAPVTSSHIISNMIFTPFPTELVQKFDVDEQGKSTGNKPGLDNEFYTGYTISVSDGVTHMISEYFEQSSRGDVTQFVKGDFLITTFLPNNKVEFQRLPRNQTTSNAVTSSNVTNYNSFTADYINNDLFVFYNDDENNAMQDLEKKPERFNNEKKSVLLSAKLTHGGKLSSRKIVYSHKDLDGFVTNLRFSPVKENTYVVFAIKSGNFKHATIAGLLTIK